MHVPETCDKCGKRYLDGVGDREFWIIPIKGVDTWLCKECHAKSVREQIES